LLYVNEVAGNVVRVLFIPYALGVIEESIALAPLCPVVYVIA
jgi:hypothetical protein